MFSPLFLLTTIVAAFCAGSSALKSHVIHERGQEHPDEWVKIDGLSPKHILPMRIGMTQRNLDVGDDLLYEMCDNLVDVGSIANEFTRSDPNSPKYGQHYTSEEVVDLFAPHEDNVQAITKWLESSGISGVTQSANKQWLQFDASVSDAESLFKTKYHFYEHSESGATRLGCDSYSIPHDLQDKIDYITPGVKKLELSEGKAASQNNRRRAERNSVVPRQLEILDYDVDSSEKKGMNESDCPEFITPKCMREQYRIPIGEKKVKGNTIGLYEPSYYRFLQSDLNQWFKKYTPYIPQGTKPLLRSIDGGISRAKTKKEAQSESTLDIQWALPVAYPDEVEFYSVDDIYNVKHYTKHSGYFNTFLDALDGSYCNYSAFGETGDNPKNDFTYPNPHKGGYHHPEMCGKYKPANVISISFGPYEHDLPVSYTRRQCHEWMKLGMQGVTVVAASGDTGVAGLGGKCLPSKHGKDLFSPSGPCNCPYVTCVGATNTGRAKDNETIIETAWAGSSGGFSNMFPRPKYQENAVQSWFNSHPTKHKSYATKWNKDLGKNGGRFNRAGRGTPDVSALGIVMSYFFRGKDSASSGTSFSAPIFGSVITRINNERLRAGKSTVGFILPALYQHPHVLTDVRSGDQVGCSGESLFSGFKATEGWDPVTGLGTPDFPKMRDMFMSLP